MESIKGNRKQDSGKNHLYVYIKHMTFIIKCKHRMKVTAKNIFEI